MDDITREPPVFCMAALGIDMAGVNIFERTVRFCVDTFSTVRVDV